MTTNQINWQAHLSGDPLPWLLEETSPGVRFHALRYLLDRPIDDVEVVNARSAIAITDPVRSILSAQDPEGFWVKPGPGYSPKYRSTVWQLSFLDQLGADPDHPQVRLACRYVLAHTQAVNGGFSASSNSSPRRPGNAGQYHCLNGNLLRALLGFGWIDDPAVQHAIDWLAAAITGDGFADYNKSGTTGPNFGCAVNESLPCAWGAIKAMSALSRVPVTRRDERVERAIEMGVELLLSGDPASAAYPMGWGETAPSRHWFKPGFPLGYQADLLQLLLVVGELGYGPDPRLDRVYEWLLKQQDSKGRWGNERSFGATTWATLEPNRHPSKWVTLRACIALKARSSTAHVSV